MSSDASPLPDVQPDREPYPGEQNTRISGAWTAVVIGLLALVLILVFILQNLQSVELSFLFADLIPGFLRNRRQDVVMMLAALDRGDFETVEFLGHGMSGVRGSWGFQPIDEIGVALELAAESADSVASRKCVGELSRYLDRVEIAFG